MKFSIEKNACVVLTRNHNERAQVVTGLRGRQFLAWLFGDWHFYGGVLGATPKAGKDGRGVVGAGADRAGADTVVAETPGAETGAEILGAETVGTEPAGMVAGVCPTG